MKDKEEDESNALSNMIIEFSQVLFLILKNLSNLPTIILERFNELFSGKCNITVNEHIPNTITPKSKKELSKIQANIVAVEDAHPRQPRCINFGEEIQTDACIHLWFGKTKTALHAAIDDSTGHVVAAYFDNQV